MHNDKSFLPMQFDVITLMPAMFDAILEYGVTSRAYKNGIFHLKTWNPRDFTHNLHKTVDDRPYGGGPGMVMLAEPLEKAIQAARERQQQSGVPAGRVIHLSPQGKLLTHRCAAALAQQPGLIILTSRYEGVDERALAGVDEEYSIGDYVLSGGELPAMVLIDTITRLLPGALGDEDSAVEDSFVNGLLDFPHYTRPAVYRGQKVPEVLLSGDHAQIQRWRLKQSLGRTRDRRPDLLVNRTLTTEEARLLVEYEQEQVSR